MLCHRGTGWIKYDRAARQKRVIDTLTPWNIIVSTSVVVKLVWRAYGSLDVGSDSHKASRSVPIPYCKPAAF